VVFPVDYLIETVLSLNCITPAPGVWAVLSLHFPVFLEDNDLRNARAGKCRGEAEQQDCQG